MNNKQQWIRSRDELTASLTAPGYPAGPGDAVARHIGCLKGIERMVSYPGQMKPGKVGLVADEMIPIRSVKGAWQEKKAGQRANAAYNDIPDCVNKIDN